MSRGQFRSRNRVGEILTFQTNHNGSGFRPGVLLDPFLNLSHRVHWDFGDSGDTAYFAGNSGTFGPNKTYPDGSLKTVQVRTNLLSTISSFIANNESLVGNLDLTKLTGLGQESGSSSAIDVVTNPSLTGITHTAATKTIISYLAYDNNLTGELVLPFTKFLNYVSFPFPIFSTGRFSVNDNPNLTKITHTRPITYSLSNRYDFYNCDITGNHDVSMFVDLGTQFVGFNNTNMTGVTHTASTRNWTFYRLDNCDLTGNHDMSMFIDGLGGNFRINTNPNLTSISHGFSSALFSHYLAYSCNLTGNHDLTMFNNLGGQFDLNDNPTLTGITHTASTATFTRYWVDDCDLTGDLDLSMFPNLGGSFVASRNPNLTSITHTTSPNNFSTYWVTNCNLTGNHDMSMILLGGSSSFRLDSNLNLTGITHTATTYSINSYSINNCDLTGTHDISMLSNLADYFNAIGNSNLTNVLFPHTTETFQDPGSLGHALNIRNCNLDYVNFLPLSGITMDVGAVNGASIDISSNGMVAGDVNHILVDFDNIVTNLNPSGWTGVTLDISSNSPPDTTSGGYDGLAAITSLTGAPNNWTVIL